MLDLGDWIQPGSQSPTSGAGAGFQDRKPPPIAIRPPLLNIALIRIDDLSFFIFIVLVYIVLSVNIMRN